MKQRQRAKATKKILALAALLAALLAGGLLWRASGQTMRNVQAQTRQSIQATVLRAAVQCCAIEGAYPASLQYLVDNYGLQIDTGAYIVTYEVFASNVLPVVEVLQK